ncbi:MAG: hypothetical protein SOV43_05705 [Selenomonadaceae bacterium]|nr:hypothetical protein [Selenomonadaceae bacterium]MDY2685650.1 hypothetical protein [Selenomonadaceae bacterium]
MTFLWTVSQLLAYVAGQTFGYSMFAVSLKRLGKIQSMHIAKAFFYLVLINFAGAATFSPDAWQHTSRPVMAGLIVIGLAFFFLAHLYLLYRTLCHKK